MYYLLSFIPVIINIVLLPIKYLHDNYSLLVKVLKYIQFLGEPIITPVYFIVLHIYFTKFTKQKKLKCYKSVMVLLLAVLINASIDYLWWGLTTGNLTNPDGLTVMAVEVVLFLALFIGYSGIGIFEFVYWLIKRKKTQK